MSGEIELGPEVLEKLRCPDCDRYLSCSPIQVRKDGSSVCGRCFRWEDGSKCRNFALEAIVCKVRFPCRFKKYGCKESVLFDHTNEHEAECAYRTFLCPILPGGACRWWGPTVQIYEHCTAQHAEFVKAKLEFTLQVGQDKQEALVSKSGDVVVALKYLYTAKGGKLQYVVKYVAFTARDVQWKVWLTNDADHDYTIGTKGGACTPYDVHFYDKQESKTLVLPDFMQNLNKPGSVVVRMDLCVAEADAMATLSLDRQLLLTLRCRACLCYLIPPIFDCKKGAVCAKCRTRFSNTKPTSNERLKALVATANFPCRWRGCTFVCRGADFGNHEVVCPCRVYECINIMNCKETFTRDEAIAHLEGHGFECFSGVVAYKVVFETKAAPKTIFTFKNNEVVCIEHETHYDTAAGEYRHYLTLKLCGSDSTDISVSVHVEHQHCKLEANLNGVWSDFGSKRWHINISEFPDCFRVDEELTFTLKV